MDIMISSDQDIFSVYSSLEILNTFFSLNVLTLITCSQFVKFIFT